MEKDAIICRFQEVRQQTEALCCPLVTEDYVIQSIEDVSPPKWHLAHTTWFFETFVLSKFLPDYKRPHPTFQYLFNSYYQGIGNPYPRANRGLLARPRVETVYAYRDSVNQQILGLLKQAKNSQLAELHYLIGFGLQHELQHQELLLMDIKHNFSIDPSFPCYKTPQTTNCKPRQSETEFIEIKGGLVDIGHRGEDFCFDNELPLHKQYLDDYLIAKELVTNGEYLKFIEAGGYQQPELWLADGWDCVLKNQWQAPLYWHLQANEWSIFTLNGLLPLDYAEPVSHLSYYEADAFARWRGARLPTEAEWEHFVLSHSLNPNQANCLETGLYHPQAASTQASPQQFYGDVWEWTSSAYSAYPGYQTLQGVLGEYNGKFMANQLVLRGGCCVTPRSQIRATYRNFYLPDKRWQFAGIRLANNPRKSS